MSVQIPSPALSVLINRKNSCNRYGIIKFVNIYEFESPSPRFFVNKFNVIQAPAKQEINISL